MANDSDGNAFSQRIGKRIAERRKALCMSRATLAGIIGITERTLQAVENGEVEVGSFQHPVIARALGIKLIDLIG